MGEDSTGVIWTTQHLNQVSSIWGGAVGVMT